MPRYFFHLEDGASMPDLEGVELPDVAAARAEAIRRLAEELVSDAGDFWNGEPWRLEAADANGTRLFTLNFSATQPDWRAARRA